MDKLKTHIAPRIPKHKMKHICKHLEHLQIQTTHKSILFQHSDLNKCKKKNVCSLQSSTKNVQS